MKNAMKRTFRERKQSAYKVFLFLFVLFALVGVTGGLRTSEAGVRTEKEIRVGLKSKFAGKKQITIENKSLELGYCDGREYCAETVLSSGSGVIVTPEKAACFVVEKEVSLQEAEKIVKKLNEEGAKAYAVLLSVGRAAVYLPVTENGETESKARANCEAAAKASGIVLQKEIKESDYLIRIDAGGRVLFADGTTGDYPQFAATEKDDDGIVSVDLEGRRYRGRIEVGRYGGRSTVTAVNVVSLEAYLYGVVPCEMPATWHMEALKAQAVCARSYALLKAGYHAETDIKRGYRMVDTVQSQVYGGTMYEHKRSNAAVDATKGQTLCYENRTVAGYYFSTSGGHTEDVEDVWGSSKTYLQGVPDIYELNPSKEPWSVILSEKRLENLLETNGKNIGEIKKVVPEIVTASGRVNSLRIIGSLDSVTLSTDELRNVLDLPGTKFKTVNPGTVPDYVAVQGASGVTETTIRDCYVISGNGDVQSAKGLTEQYVVLSKDNLTNFPASAPEEGTYLLAGMGHGHGVGMSQSGARGMAEAGYDYQEILEHYFTGISVR